VHVCRRWRYLVLGSASHLDLCLLCTHGTPVADMLAHSPPFPLVIDHYHRDSTEDDIEQIMLALQYRDRVRRIRLIKAIPVVEKLIAAIDDEFPMLEYLCITPERITSLALPRTFQAPRLRHLILSNLVPPIGSPTTFKCHKSCHTFAPKYLLVHLHWSRRITQMGLAPTSLGNALD
jgi:hypothetical protein